MGLLYVVVAQHSKLPSLILCEQHCVIQARRQLARCQLKAGSALWRSFVSFVLVMRLWRVWRVSQLS